VLELVALYDDELNYLGDGVFRMGRVIEDDNHLEWGSMSSPRVTDVMCDELGERSQLNTTVRASDESASGHVGCNVLS